MIRYDLVCDNWLGSDLKECEGGEYVKYEDVAKLHQTNQELIEALEKVIPYAEDWIYGIVYPSKDVQFNAEMKSAKETLRKAKGEV